MTYNDYFSRHIRINHTINSSLALIGAGLFCLGYTQHLEDRLFDDALIIVGGTLALSALIDHINNHNFYKPFRLEDKVK